MRSIDSTLVYTLLISLILTGCQTAPSKKVAANNTPSSSVKNHGRTSLFHQDSTIYFSNRQASISMRASLESSTPSDALSNSRPLFIKDLKAGYKLQFRSIHQENILIEQMSIVAGGKLFIITEKPFFIPSNKSVNLSLSLEDSLFISQQDDAVLRFKYEGESQLLTIKSHKLNNFIVE